MQILQIISSARGAESYSTQLSQGIIDKLRAAHPGSSVVVRNLAKNPFPHLEEAHLQAYFTPVEARSTEQQQAVRHSDEAIAEVLAADVLVIGVPFYNFSIASSLKSWLDHLTRAGITFRYTPTGPEGLITDKRVYLAVASGGIYSEGPMQPYDFATPYLRWMLGFLGMTDITVARAEGVKLPEFQAQALQKGLDSVAV
ncbi:MULTISPECIES: FMN-dependent NADH-azoreductase [Hymenobacter]|uniref:FMN dependent NADH:quinone oxidoreductase n=1 Tax=Hymenobacter profundi TaxID=1982110 RepID=A0ABS6WW56_9BACT|nr:MULTISPECIES: FMN-dependent NADH-azoreductase [Hymenobacter]MBW3127830.1 FMN-dependent NADH-azoreductase [Hymenobacter profundi]QNE39770.1 FMN-dependent NADH-azoreductase [Hymenobacter sp. NBH84]